MFDWIDWFFAKNKPSLTKYPAYLGHTVHQEEYDKLIAELAEIRKYLIPFASVGSTLRGRTTDSTVELAAQAHDLLKAGTVTMKQQAREIEQLTEQLDALRQQQIMLTTNPPGNVKPVPGAMPGTYTMDALTTTPTNKRKSRTTGAQP